MKTRLTSALLTAALAGVPSVAHAHGGVGHATGFFSGFEHPVGGLDHVLAMVLVGVLAAQLGGRALLAVPLAFLALMALGGALGMAGAAVPFVELGIALSIVVIGAAVALGVRLPVAAAAAVVGLFAVFHGHAHGAEMPMEAGGLAYGLGFVSATALLHALGLGVGFAVRRLSERFGPAVVRAAGGLAGLAGVAILTGAL